jgi:hypothetical protein
METVRLMLQSGEYKENSSRGDSLRQSLGTIIYGTYYYTCILLCRNNN